MTRAPIAPGLWTALSLLCLAPANAADEPASGAPAAAPAAAASAPGRPAPGGPAGPPATPQRVEITATQAPDSNDERRRSTASRISFGREELDRMGDSTLGEVLKRLPGVTIGGTPGRGGAIHMRGMGGGYTQILIDGQRMAPGFSLDSIAPEQIERIEVMRAPVAEHSTQAIAGTINVIMRSDFKRKTHEFRIGGGADGGRGQAGASWINNGQTDLLGYNLTATVFQGGQGNASDTHTRFADANDLTTLDRQEHSSSESRRKGLFANGRLQFKLGPGQSLDLQPFFNSVRTHSSGQAELTQALPLAPTPGSLGEPAYRQAHWTTESRWAMARLNSTAISGTPLGGRLQLNVNTSLSDSASLTQRNETGGSAGAGRNKVDDARQRELSADLKARYSQLLAERHSASGGLELARSQRTDSRTSTVDGASSLAEFGEDIQATNQRIALWAQDEWDWSKTFSFYAGARWEAITTRSDALTGPVHNRSAVFTPLAQMVWKLPDAPRDQIRASLTRSYRAPNTGQLIARPSLTQQYKQNEENSAISPDRAGNPDLLPELSWGLELGAEHYLDAGGILSANVFLKRIDNLIRTVRSQQLVSWSTARRWVARPQNIGQADVAGLELEAKGRLSDLLRTELPITLRSNLTLMWSQVNQVQGPNNRIEGQAPYTANLGADWPIKGTPLALGANLNFTPGFQITQIDNQVYRQGVKRVVDANAVWRFNPDASLRLTVSNAGARRYDSANTLLLLDANGLPAGSQGSDTSSRSYTSFNLRGEFRF